ncbi:hypothetical protein [Aeromicrobium sp. CnD17-E]|uniref:hypothetical protein n=1 Tax=Aeromicrobium sp. CnD17-E TaxID=2954487 RepID=UPI00209790C7|nr:hypothetical protein [Aeromicrobium sp. CnD17-E]MCO7239487.1 hypothetical protein [Aeromicrobium sp. CnD17-E]
MGISSYEADFEQRLDQCWLSVMVADVLQFGGGASGWKSVSRDVRAGAVVMAIGEFEALLKHSVEDIHQTIEASGSVVKDLRHGVRMLHFDPRFSAAAGSALDSVWSTRIELSEAHECIDPPRLPRRDHTGNLQPLGNRTPKPATLARLWLVYELPGVPFPNFAWRKSLGEMVEIRNDVAHGRMPIAQVFAGGARTVDAVATYVMHVRDLGKHVVDSLSSYTADRGYLL